MCLDMVPGRTIRSVTGALTAAGEMVIVCRTGLNEDDPRAFVAEQGFFHTP